MYQERLISAITKKIGKHQSVIDEVSHVLDISYDAAHRRISMKSKFSIEEAVLLAQHFGISMDRTFQGGENVLVKKTKEIRSFHDLALYLENSLKSLTEYQANNQTTLYYSAKDIPLFYTIETNLLSKFKLYVWLNLLDFDHGDMSFESFQLQAPTVENSKKLKDFYNAVNTREIWNDTTINSTLQQIMYFFQSGLLTIENGKLLCDSLKELIYSLAEKCVPNNDQYQLYYHDLLILNNNVLVSDAHQKSLFVPYTMLGYFITKDMDTCKNAADFFQHQLKNSKLLNTAGTRDKKMFFNRAYQKIDFYKNQITSIQEFG
ncbi:hypothetical protein [Parapedobacter tibetensis]|uniref:hypothetical protein n=1 Tax=Parapedobacter tibetensis TaxID=2972951 RepID=UPI00214D29BA|nr:hypothetical protein [Parapedobacter tibetensis]